MKNSPVVVFDLGKVLLDFDFGIAARKIAQRSGRSPQEIEALINQSPLLYRLESGRMSEVEFFEEIRRASGFLGDLAEFERLFAEIFAPIPAMVELHATLRSRGVRTFIFSNTNGFAIRHVRRDYPFFAEFDDYILSYEHGAMKPAPSIYEVVEQKTARRGADIFYIDDREENFLAGRERGWSAIFHTDPAKTRQALRSAEFPV
jgi:HAD superfamily hydrolase (TIGR01509 family)